MSKEARLFVLIALVMAIPWVAAVWFVLTSPPIMIPAF
jgi:hypothetical protein